MKIEELKAMSVEQLKALAYDQIVTTENAKNNLAILNEIIREKIKGAEVKKAE